MAEGDTGKEMTDKIVILSTCESREEAARIARQLVDKRVAACVSILPGVESVYWWQGKIEQAAEVLLVIKSSRGMFDRVKEELLRMHSYQTPEAIAIPIVAGSEAYLDWMARELQTE